MRSGSSARSELTLFQQRVYRMVARIPAGRTMTYGGIAKRLGTSPRAVGQALKANPFGYCAYPTEVAAKRACVSRVPCHRVVAASGLGGFTARGRQSVSKKRQLLEQEGWNE